MAFGESRESCSFEGVFLDLAKKLVTLWIIDAVDEAGAIGPFSLIGSLVRVVSCPDSVDITSSILIPSLPLRTSGEEASRDCFASSPFVFVADVGEETSIDISSFSFAGGVDIGADPDGSMDGS